MAAQQGKLVLLKVDTAGGSPQNYVTVGGQRVTTLTVGGEAVDVNTKDDDGWQAQLAGAGIKSIGLTCSGMIQADQAGNDIEGTLQGWVMDQSINWYQITFQNGKSWEVQFQLQTMELTGEHDGAEQYTLTLNSHSTPNFIAAT